MKHQLTVLSLFVAGFLFSLGGVAATGISYHGRLMLPSGEPVRAVTQFRIQIRTPGNENCLMYEETTSRDLSQTDGVFSITIGDGSGSRTDSLNWSLDKIFANRSKFEFVSNCTLTYEYIPNISDGRRLQVSFNDGSFAGWEDLPVQNIGYAPISIEAIQVGGFKASHLLRVQDALGEPQSVAALTPAYFAELVALAAGTSTTYLKAANDLTIPGKLTANEICIGADCKTAWPAGGGGGSGTVTEVTSANGYLAVTNGTSTPQLTLNVGTAANTVAAGNDSRFTDARAPTGNAGGDLGGTYPNPSVEKIQGNAVVAATIAGADTGKVYRWNGAAFEAAYLNFSDLRTVGGASQLPAACAVNEKMQWSALTDAFTCQVIGINANQITAGTIDPARLPPLTASPGGADRSVQFNDNGTLAGDAGLSYSAPGALFLGTRPGSYSADGSLYIYSTAARSGVNLRSADTGNSTNDGAEIAQVFSDLELINYENGYMGFKTNNLSRMRILADGKVGIGTDTPSEKLEVAGKIKATEFCIDASCISAWPSGGAGGDFMADGTVPMTGAFKAANGSNLTPSISFANRPNLGFYYTSGNWMEFAAGGVKYWNFGSSISGTMSGGASMRGNSAGTAADPTYGFVGQLGSGMYNTGGGQMVGFSTSGTERMLIAADGNIGIGVTNPSEKLEVAGKVKATELCIGADCRSAWPSGGGADNLGNHTATQNIQLGTNWLSGDGGNEGVYVAADGKVGIGTAAPASLLQVNGDANINSLTVGRGTASIVTNTTVATNGLAAVTTGANLTAVGYDALKAVTAGANNSAFGSSALATSTTGNNNTAIGYQSMYLATSGAQNTAVGAFSLVNSGNNNNTALGYFSLNAATAGANNTSLGAFSLATSTTGHSNTATGFFSLNKNTTGGENTAAGFYSLQGNTTGGRNVALGTNALYSATVSSGNTVVGVDAFYDFNNTTGGLYTNNTIVGYNSGRGIVTGTHNTIIGADVTGLAAGLSNNVIIADGAGNRRINVDATGKVGIGTTAPTEMLEVAGKVKATELCIGADCKNAWPAAGGSGTVTEVTSANAYLTVATGTTTPALTLNVGTAANTVAAGDDARFTDSRTPTGVAAGDLGGTYPDPTVEKIRGNTVAVGTIPGADVGKVYRWDGSNLVATFLNFGDLRTAAGAQQLTASCAANEKIQWSVITDAFTCQAIGLLDASAITAGTIDEARLPASAKLWDSGSGNVYRTTGNVGVGIASPATTLHVYSSQAAATAQPDRAGIIVDGEGTSYGGRIAARAFSATEGPIFSGYRSLGTKAAPTAVTSGKALVSLVGYGYDGSNWSANTSSPGITLEASETWTGSNKGSRMGFGTTPNGSSTVAERMRIDQNGNIGMGTSTPYYALDIYRANATTNMRVASDNTSTTAARYPSILVENFMGSPATSAGGSPAISLVNYRGNSSTTAAMRSGEALGALAFGGSYNTSGSYHEGAAIWGRAAENYAAGARGTDLAFYTTAVGSNTSTEKMTLTANGRLGIGTASPGYNLQVNGSIGATSIEATTTGFGTMYTAAAAVASSRNLDVMMTVQNNATDGFSAISFLTAMGGAKGVVGYANSGTGALANSVVLGSIEATTPIIFGIGGNEAARVNHTNGFVGIGTNNPQNRLHVFNPGAGTVASFQNDSGSCTITPVAGSIACSSDIRLKKNIDNILGLDALNKVLSLQAKTYEWKNSDGHRYIGYIAQEVEKIVPEVVSEDENGRKQITYAAVVPLLSEAMKEMHHDQKRDIASVRAENETLQKQVDTLKKQNESLEARLQKLEALLQNK